MRHRQWSRFAQPSMQAWAPSGEPFRLVEREADSDDEDPKALACYGVYLPTNEKESSSNEDASKKDESEMLLRFVEGRPVSEVTTTFLEWVCERLDERGTDVWTLIWDQASWHTSHKVQNWIHQHNEWVKEKGGVRILACEFGNHCDFVRLIAGHAGISQKCRRTLAKSLKKAPDAPF